MTTKLQQLEVQREGLINEGMGRKHPNVLSLDSQIDGVQNPSLRLRPRRMCRVCKTAGWRKTQT
jgi:hypothetical protein